MGAVYEAVDLRLDTVVALKETLFTEERLRKQFEREARLLARLHHQALPRVSDHFTEGDGQFLVMQYIPGEDLFEMQGRRGSAFPQADVLQWADQLCDALDYLHTQDPQIIHRDIKPQNLKLSARGQIVLLDFGLAKGSGGQMSVVTTSASIFGYTPNYAPLEQVQGMGTDPRSDIYSLAATLYHLLTNVKPPDALSRAAAIVNGLPDPLTPADAISPQVSRAVASVLEKGMSQKRDERYASAEEMREAFRIAAAQAPGETATVITPAGVVTSPNTVFPAASTQVAAPQTKAFGNEARTLLAEDATRIQTHSSLATAGQSQPPRRFSRTWLATAAVIILVGGVAAGFLINRARNSQITDNAPATSQTPAPTNSATPAPEPSVEVATEASPQPTQDPTPKTETTTQRARQTARPTPDSRDAATHGDRDRNLLEPPLIDQTRPPERPRRPEPGEPPNVITLSNGTRIETRSDGTRTITMPDGRTRVFPPGTRPNPRRRPTP